MLYPKRSHRTHKGDNGIVLVIGGSEDYVGAPTLTGLAAIRAGADLAIIACPEKTAYAINAISPDLITKKLDGKFLRMEHVSEILKLVERADVIAIGPGLGLETETLKAVEMLCNQIKKPKVIDADAIKARPKLQDCVVTPHAKEFEILFGVKPREKLVKKFSKRNCIILLKGHTDIISDGKRVVRNRTGNAGMTHGGTGDVLTGIIAGLIAQKMPLFKAACLAAEINGKAGDILFERKGYGYIASDILDIIPILMKA